MALKFDGVEYRTIQDVQDEFKTSAKTIKKLITNGTLPAPEEKQRGARPFRYFNDAWMAAAKKYFSNVSK